MVKSKTNRHKIVKRKDSFHSPKDVRSRICIFWFVKRPLMQPTLHIVVDAEGRKIWMMQNKSKNYFFITLPHNYIYVPFLRLHPILLTFKAIMNFMA